ncbi:MAG TPA: flagellar protein FlaG [Armatimonadota bacterium]|jgi:flagellar protein FlaG|nr:flagellar protein FlaG [Armatimonadota bacterium]HOP78966.1 flagellar protein FlaG [Armatimonadota bacterium]HPP75247.1 flagellar protein FlaG [Armatimonadota bacterium]
MSVNEYTAGDKIHKAASKTLIRTRPDSSRAAQKTSKRLNEAASEVMEHLSRLAVNRSTSFQLSVHEATDRFVVQIINNETGQVTREIPSEHVLNGIASLLQNSELCADHAV